MKRHLRLGPNRDHGPRAGSWSYASRTSWHSLAAGPARGPLAVRGQEELRDLEWSHGCRHDLVTVTGCFQSLPAGHG